MMDRTTLRRYRITDAPAVSDLFEAIYGTHYPQPHVYLPCMISQNHSDGRWHSLVAVLNELRQPDDGIWALYPQNRHLSAKVRILVDYLAAKLN